MTLITDYRFVDLICQFRKKYPNCTIHNLEVDSVDTATSMLVRGNGDAVVKNILRGEGCSVMMAELTALQEQGDLHSETEKEKQIV